MNDNMFFTKWITFLPDPYLTRYGGFAGFIRIVLFRNIYKSLYFLFYLFWSVLEMISFISCHGLQDNYKYRYNGIQLRSTWTISHPLVVQSSAGSTDQHFNSYNAVLWSNTLVIQMYLKTTCKRPCPLCFSLDTLPAPIYKPFPPWKF